MIKINICMENGGRIEFIKHESLFIPTLENERLIVLSNKPCTERNEYLYSQIVAFSCWIHPTSRKFQ